MAENNRNQNKTGTGANGGGSEVSGTPGPEETKAPETGLNDSPGGPEETKTQSPGATKVSQGIERNETMKNIELKPGQAIIAKASDHNIQILTTIDNWERIYGPQKFPKKSDQPAFVLVEKKSFS